MSGQELFERVLGSLHEATLDDALWPATSGLIDEACETKGNFLTFGTEASADDVDIFFARFCFRGQRREDLERLYFTDYHALDERLPRIRRLPDSRIAHVATLYTEDEKKTSPVYNEVLALGDTANSLNVRLDGPDGSRIVWVAADPVDGDGWSTARIETVERLLPHLRQFVRVRQALVDAEALGPTVSGLLETTRCGVIQLDRDGRILAANDRARRFLREGDGLTDREGRLCAASAEDDAALQRLLARAVPRFGAGESGSMTLKRPVVSPRLVLHASPVGDAGMDVRPGRIAALVLAIDPAGRGRIDPGVVGEMLGLTPAESQVAVLLAQGYTSHEIAVSTGRGEGTIRWHIRQIFGKHALSRQLELVHLVLALSDLPGTFRQPEGCRDPRGDGTDRNRS